MSRERMILFYVGCSALMLVGLMVVEQRRRRQRERLSAAAPDGTRAGVVAAENPVERMTKRRLQQEERQEKLRHRLMQAGFYDRAASHLFVVVRVVMIAGAAAAGFALGRVFRLPLAVGLGAGAVGGLAATVAPSFWLDRVKGRRQNKIRCALPDALDVLVVCLEGGLSVMGALSRVARELAVAHPMLAVELKIVERQMQLGQTAGEALLGMAHRFDLEELRGMASVLRQAEKIGSSVASALDVFAESMRLKRHQGAEERAQKAAIKILFPTILCIFPAMFVVILGPAAIQVYNQLLMGALANAPK
jgi:tight adherence protein C